MQDIMKFFLNTMDVPSARRDVTDPANLRWLSRNLAVRNSLHPDLKPCLNLIRKALRGKSE
jgi:hypothetical protein